MQILIRIQQIVWGPILLLLVLGTGIYLTIRLNWIQVFKLPLAMKYIFQQEKTDDGDVSSFAALCTALAATIGTGNIVGVATALRSGGPGALFWMWVAAFFGMATKYAESCLAVKYRVTDDKGQKAGGPMYYIEYGMGKKWRWMGKLFAFFGIFVAYFGCGVFAQVNSITEASQIAFHIPIPVVGITVALVSGVVILGGIESISKVAGWCVPFMAIFYTIGAIICIASNAERLPMAIHMIFKSAFTPAALAGGASGTLVISAMAAMRNGVARGVFSNEAGLGSGSIISAAAQTNSCVRQGLVSMTGTFFDTICICTMTGLVILTSGVIQETNFVGVALTNAAFSTGLPEQIGVFIVTVGLIFFAFTSIIGWNYYGERCLVYLVKSTKWNVVYRIIYILLIIIAPYLALDMIWTLADVTNACMAFPNLIAILGLSGILFAETKEYFENLKR